MSLPANNRRIVQMLWLAAGLLFVLAFLSAIGGSAPQAKEWAANKVGSITQLRSGRPSLREAMERSEALWKKTVRQRHEMIAADYGDASKMPMFPAINAEIYKTSPYSIWDFTPASWSCPHEMERVGRMGDGGKWVCGMSHYVNFPKNKQCVIYSFGVRDESSFENEMLSRTPCYVWAYDFSVVDFGEQLEASNRARAQFLQVGIAGKTDLNATPPFYSIRDLMEMNGHQYIDILKMDIEEAEFEAIDGLMADFASGEFPIGQLMVEIHFFTVRNSKTYLDWWERMEARGLRPTWTEPNLLAVTLGFEYPQLAEYTLVNVDDRNNVLFHGR
ncbi:hypothetical protein CGCF415_v007090 [Colletotrichum fructicola]|uniref:Methyltransferase domain-containing protein n=3 Tax=Colletotrichum gloeosporioides species complex TaxID=2707338 RepID=L2FK08_COLFN|nr:uncharacterized protein CGMCC3_g3703 [Colletotrichum fructicola]XP_037176595.1 uncharacterized protein CGCA056_v009227 [Colletotrichum aenigma]XP_053039310.1 uncharacterized protein COL26b_003811 [Colletotrichum chrysophilum]KAF4479698.1 hypothetical protein CGGC5_v011867 [Colletotrichum fructicola Nara gc5]KAJ0285969.1 hypothetical protein COL940_003248 [Colletotrichum noveboracense]KAJ0292569.1 hypothetical protein CBS470a_002670 [Colletotrichum nupharicola]KAE9580232.1 hypothetical prot